MNYQNDESQVTIAIPTYNRSAYLDQCLEYMMPQVAETWPVFKVIIIDNQSTDNTWSIIEKYQARYPAHIKAIRNSENIGADANIAKCYDECNTRYAWIFGDDDVISPESLTIIAEKIKTSEYATIHLKAQPYTKKPHLNIPSRKKNLYKKINRSEISEYLYDVSDMFSFITGNIINKKLVPKDIDTKKFIWTKYNQISWTFGALFSDTPSLLIKDNLLYINNEENSGHYPFCKVFGTNYNIIFRYFEERGIQKKYFDIINKKMARELFTPLIYFARTIPNFRNYTPEDYFSELKPNFIKYWEFWLFILPMCKLPKVALPIHFFAIRVFNRLYRYLR